MAGHGSSAALAGLVVEAVEWLPSGADSGLVRVRARWSDPARGQQGLPALGVRRGDEARRFDSLPDARFGRDPAVWRGTYLVPAALMDPAPDELWLSWEGGARADLPAPARGFEPPAAPEAPPAPPEPGGEVIDRAVLAERRARRAEAAEQAQARRAAEALKAVEVLELRSAELERRLEALQSEAPTESSPAEPALRSADSVVRPSAEPIPPATPVAPDTSAAALTAAVAAVKRLRFELGEQRQRLRRSELLRAADAVALATFREAEGRARRLQVELKARERELAAALERAEATAAEAATAREQAAEQVALAAQRAAADAAAVRSRAAEELAAERAAGTEAHAELEATGRDLAAERAAHAGTRERLAQRERELAAIGTELAGVRAELAAVRHDAQHRAAELEHRLTGLDAALEEERRVHGIAATERETALAGLALAESARSAESVARAALDEELDRERAARATLTAALDAARAELVAAQTTQAELVLSREQARAELTAASERAASAEASARTESAAANERAASAEASARTESAAASERAAGAEAAREAAVAAEATARAELAAASSAEASGRAELATARERAASAEASAAELRSELDAARVRFAAAQARIADLERELEAGRSALDSAGREAGGLLARIAELESAADGDLDRRAREQAAAASAVTKPDGDERRELSASFDAAAAALRARPAHESAPPAEPAADRPARPRIVTEAKHPARADIVGSSKRRYPWLRGALVKLAHDDPRAATRLVLGLVPVQHALVEAPLEYDLTIRGSGTYAISIGAQGAAARSVGGPRPRAEAAFHASADIVTLAELLAGVDKRMGRWIGSVKVHGRRGSAETLRAALVKADLDLAAAARAGANLDPDLVFRAFAYAIHPSWTKGHTFTVAQEIAGPRPMRWHVAVRDGGPVSVERRAPAQPPDAVVSMTRAAFAHLLRGEQSPSGERPVIRGDRAAVAVLKSWTDRAQGHA